MPEDPAVAPFRGGSRGPIPPNGTPFTLTRFDRQRPAPSSTLGHGWPSAGARLHVMGPITRAARRRRGPRGRPPHNVAGGGHPPCPPPMAARRVAFRAFWGRRERLTTRPPQQRHCRCGGWMTRIAGATLPAQKARKDDHTYHPVVIEATRAAGTGVRAPRNILSAAASTAR